MFKTLYAKISTIFLILILFLGALLLYLSLQSSLSYVCEATQKLNYNIASQFAHRCEPFLKDSMHYSQLSTDILDFHELNPNADIFILAADGKIMISSSPPEKIQHDTVDMKVIHRFLQPNSYKQLPMFGDDPLVIGEQKIFSVAEMSINEEQTMYVYVTLASARSDLASDGIASSYILRSGSLAIIVTLFFTAIIGLFLFFILTKRVHTVTQAVKEFAKGNYTKRILHKANEDEVAQLAVAFNRMADTIEKNMQQMETNDQMRRDLIANISHDLRSPLTSIQGYLETIQIKNEELEHSKKEEFLNISLKNVRQLDKLVNQLFELSKLDAKETKPNKETFSSTELVQDVVLKFQPQADENGISIKSKISEQLPLVSGDIGMIERVISNLIDNAIKYSKTGANISVNLIQQNKNISFQVCDTGPGISEQDLPFVFHRFFMADKSRTKGGQGSGLGLAIAKKIMEAHDSKIEVSSKINEGTKFTFYLPIVS